MFHQWIDNGERSSERYRKDIPASPPAERKRLRERFFQIKKVCDDLLETWAEIEDQSSAWPVSFRT